MSKWKCEICGAEFENFHAQGFDNKIYCPLCYFKKENQELKKQLEEKNNGFVASTEELVEYAEENEKLKEQLEVGKEQYKDLVEEKEKIKETYDSLVLKHESQQKEFIEWLENKIKERDNDIKLLGSDCYTSKYGYKETLSKYKEITGVKDE